MVSPEALGAIAADTSNRLFSTVAHVCSGHIPLRSFEVKQITRKALSGMACNGGTSKADCTCLQANCLGTCMCSIMQKEGGTHPSPAQCQTLGAHRERQSHVLWSPVNSRTEQTSLTDELTLARTRQTVTQPAVNSPRNSGLQHQPPDVMQAFCRLNYHWRPQRILVAAGQCGVRSPCIRNQGGGQIFIKCGEEGQGKCYT